MLFMCLFIGTSISVGSSSPLLIGRFCHRHHHPRPRLTRRRSGEPIAHVTSPSRDVCRLPQVSSLSMRVVVASPPRAAVRHVVDYVAAAPPRQQRGLSSSSRYVASSASSTVVCRRPLLLHLHRCRLCRRISCARSELFDTYELRRHTRRWSAPCSSSSSSSTSSTNVTLQWRCRGHSSYVSWLSRRGNFRILDVSPCLPLRLLSSSTLLPASSSHPRLLRLLCSDNCDQRQHSCHTAPQPSWRSSLLVPSDADTWLGPST